MFLNLKYTYNEKLSEYLIIKYFSEYMICMQLQLGP